MLRTRWCVEKSYIVHLPLMCQVPLLNGGNGRSSIAIIRLVILFSFSLFDLND